MLPEPPPDVVAAILAAISELWPSAGVPDVGSPRDQPTWRFSGRWWSKPTVLRRDRPGGSR
ncbi:MAG: hypothetical protein ABSC00_00045 [Acidimicrobiales bacterium]